MRQFLLGLSISVAFILGCVTAQHVPGVATPSASASTATYTGQRWEYMCAKGPSFANIVKFYDELPIFLNEHGAAGWEYIPHELDRFCFKRPQ
jgi:hypothetical protein